VKFNLNVNVKAMDLESRLFERHFLSLVFADQRLCPHAKALALND